MDKTKFGLFTFMLLTLLSMTIVSCKNDNEEDLFPSFECDLSDTRYSTTVEPILAANCYVCHDQDNADQLGGGLNLEGYDAVLPWAESGSLFGAINRDEGFAAMPANGAKLPQCSIDQIKQWIDNGAMDN